jgi:N6-adenosine-specific RNA methylase IME4
MKYERHEYNFFPSYSKEDKENLTKSIQQGYDSTFPIILFEGKILDGFNRYEVCNELKVLPIYKNFEGSKEEALRFSVNANKNRRHLSASQMAAIAVDAEEIVNKIAEEVKKNQIRKPTITDSVKTLVSEQNSQQGQTSAKIIGDLFGVGQTYIKDAKKLKVSNKKDFQDIKDGKKTIKEVVTKNKNEARIKDIKEVDAKIQEEAKIIKKENRIYDAIIIDPPWRYCKDDELTYDAETRRVASPYPTMSLDEIKNIKLPLKDDSTVFLWITPMFLQHFNEILDTWGLKYKTIITWNKVKMGMGNFLRHQCEYVIVAEKGKPKYNITHNQIDYIESARREHSRKPDEFYTIVENLCIGMKLDYFAREQRNGFDAYGIEVGKFNEPIKL